MFNVHPFHIWSSLYISTPFPNMTGWSTINAMHSVRQGFALGGSGVGEPRTIFIVHEYAFSLISVAQDEFCRLTSGVVRGAHCASGKKELKIFTPSKVLCKITWISTNTFITSELPHIWQKYTRQPPHTIKPLGGAQKLQHICLFSCQHTLQ